MPKNFTGLTPNTTGRSATSVRSVVGSSLPMTRPALTAHPMIAQAMTNGLKALSTSRSALNETELNFHFENGSFAGAAFSMHMPPAEVARRLHSIANSIESWGAPICPL